MAPKSWPWGTTLWRNSFLTRPLGPVGCNMRYSEFGQRFWVSNELPLDHQIAGPGPLPEAGPAKCALTQGGLAPSSQTRGQQEDNKLNQQAEPTCETKLLSFHPGDGGNTRVSFSSTRGLFAIFIRLKLFLSCCHLLSCVTCQGWCLFLFSMVVFYALFVMLISLKFCVFRPSCTAQ